MEMKLELQTNENIIFGNGLEKLVFDISKKPLILIEIFIFTKITPQPTETFNFQPIEFITHTKEDKSSKHHLYPKSF